MRFQISGLPARQYVIEASANLAVWESFRTMTADTNGLFDFVESDRGNIAARFFRARTP